MQTYGTHNSYHVPPPAKVLNFLDSIDKITGGSATFGQQAQINNLQLGQQLSLQNIRNFELDMYWDPKVHIPML